MLGVGLEESSRTKPMRSMCAQHTSVGRLGQCRCGICSLLPGMRRVLRLTLEADPGHPVQELLLGMDAFAKPMVRTYLARSTGTPPRQVKLSGGGRLRTLR